MKQNYFLFKILVGVFIWTLVFSGLASLALHQAQKEDPQIFGRVASKLGWKVTKHFVGWSIQDSEPELAPAQNEHKWTFQIPANQIELKIINGDIEILRSEGREVVLTASGLVDDGDGTKLLGTSVDSGGLQIYQPEDVEVANLKIKLEIPRGFRDSISIKTVSGDLKIQEVAVRKMEVRTVSGNLDVLDAQSPEMDFKAVSGNILLETEGIGRLKAQTVSGDVRVKLTEGEDVSYQLKSMSGTIKNVFSNKARKQSTVEVQTMSGEIIIEKR